MKMTFLALTALVSASAFAEAPKAAAPQTTLQRQMQMTPQERMEKMLRTTGGFVKTPDSMKGKVAVINTQDVVPADAISAVAARIKADSKVNFVYEKAAAGDPEQLLKNSGAAAAVIVINDAKQPTALIAIEDGWAIVNVAKLDRNLKTPEAKAKFLPVRTAHEVSRCMAILCGGARSQFKGNILDVRRLEDLDLIDNGGIPMDRVQAMVEHLRNKGVTQERLVAYRKACMEGWAAQPTNEYQKAVWDKVHTLPSKPIKIKYDPKKGE